MSAHIDIDIDNLPEDERDPYNPALALYVAGGWHRVWPHELVRHVCVSLRPRERDGNIRYPIGEWRLLVPQVAVIIDLLPQLSAGKLLRTRT